MRKQTIYWFLTALLLVVFACVPYAQVETAEYLFKCNVFRIKATAAGVQSINTFPLFLLLVVCVGLPVVCLFVGKERKLQLRLSVLNMLLIIGLIVLILYYAYSAKKTLTGILSFRLSAVLPLLALLLSIGAIRGTWKDVIFLKRMDRLR